MGRGTPLEKSRRWVCGCPPAPRSRWGAVHANQAVAVTLGCRELVHECFSKIYPGLLQDMVDWTAPTRRWDASLQLCLHSLTRWQLAGGDRQAARLMMTLLRYEGNHVTMHLQKVTATAAAPAVGKDEVGLGGEGPFTRLGRAGRSWKG